MLLMLSALLGVSLTLSTPFPQAPAPSGPRDVAILVYEGVELLDFSGPGEVFSAARGKDGRAFRVFTVAATKSPITSQHFVTVTPEFSFADCPAPEIVVVPGGNVPSDAAHVEWLRALAPKSELVMSVCNGALLAAAAGLLDGLEATTHHGSLEGLATEYPKTRVYTNRRFVDSGRVMTCAGVSAGIDGALHVVERLHGAEAARSTARYMEYEWRPAEIEALHAQPGALVDLGGVRAAVEAQAELARASGIDPKTLVFGCPPCGGSCDALRFAAAGTCKSCGMALVNRGAAPTTEQ
jgi:transcriptional regulator GlxA family with amidase domain